MPPGQCRVYDRVKTGSLSLAAPPSAKLAKIANSR